MLYSSTRASLLSTLNERNFLDTLFGASLKDFSFPTRLRNSRKHDYQNPQLAAKNKPPSEAAGVGTGGARRNFGALSTATAAAGGSKPAATSPTAGSGAGAAVFGAPAPKFTAKGLQGEASGLSTKGVTSEEEPIDVSEATPAAETAAPVPATATAAEEEPALAQSSETAPPVKKAEEVPAVLEGKAEAKAPEPAPNPAEPTESAKAANDAPQDLPVAEVSEKLSGDAEDAAVKEDDDPREVLSSPVKAEAPEVNVEEVKDAQNGAESGAGEGILTHSAWTAENSGPNTPGTAIEDVSGDTQAEPRL